MLNVVAMFVIGHALAEAGPTPGRMEAEVPTASNMAREILGDADTPARLHQDLFDLGVAVLPEGFAGLRS